jgi:hypothetical protein
VKGALCNDGNDCTSNDACDGLGKCGGTPYSCKPGICESSASCDGKGGCTALPKALGEVCDDSNLCTKKDACDGLGKCGSTPYSCPQPTECQASVLCDGLGGCSVSNKALNTPCTADGNVATLDVCDGKGVCSHPIASGKCVIGGKAYSVNEKNPANGCQACLPTVSQTAWSNLASATLCNDGNSCTSKDMCDGNGVCKGTIYSCTAGACDQSSVCDGTGGCKVTPKVKGALCNDGSDCTSNDACDGAGKCLGVSYSCPKPADCQDTVSCDGKGGCAATHKPANTPCLDDGQAATLDVCDGKGACTHPLASEKCLINGKSYSLNQKNPANGCQACVPSLSMIAWSNLPNTTLCDDGNLCTAQDTCDGKGHCQGAVYSCTPAPCELSAVCDGMGGCLATPKALGASCDDSNACTQADVCDGLGKCNGSAYACPPPTVCQEQVICDGQGGCSYSNKAQDTPCNDGNSCTKDERCDGNGLCQGTPIPGCKGNDGGAAVQDGGTPSDGTSVTDAGGLSDGQSDGAATKTDAGAGQSDAMKDAKAKVPDGAADGPMTKDGGNGATKKDAAEESEQSTNSSGCNCQLSNDSSASSTDIFSLLSLGFMVAFVLLRKKHRAKPH